MALLASEPIEFLCWGSIPVVVQFHYEGDVCERRGMGNIRGLLGSLVLELILEGILNTNKFEI